VQEKDKMGVLVVSSDNHRAEHIAWDL